jgi:hypothetical protein
MLAVSMETMADIELIVSGGTLSYTYLWSNGATTQDLINISAGSYTVVVTDANGCEATQTFIITQPTLLTASATPTAVTCFGLANGSIALTVGGGTIYGYHTLCLDKNGRSTVRIHRSKSIRLNRRHLQCNRYRCQRLYRPGFGSHYPAHTDFGVRVGNQPALLWWSSTGAINITASGGAGNYTYAWSTINGSGLVVSAEDQTGLTAGTYTVTVTDGNNCSTQASYTITSPTEIQLSAVASDISCFGGADGSITLSVSRRNITLWIFVDNGSDPTGNYRRY